MVDAEPLWQCDSLRVERRPRECRVLHCQLGAERCDHGPARLAQRAAWGLVLASERPVAFSPLGWGVRKALESERTAECLLRS